jgi:hypothetical protein
MLSEFGRRNRLKPLSALIGAAVLLSGCDEVLLRPPPVELTARKMQFSTLFAGQSEQRTLVLDQRAAEAVSLEWLPPESPFRLVSMPGTAVSPGQHPVLVEFRPLHPGDFRSWLRVEVNSRWPVAVELVGMADEPPPYVAETHAQP